jgi:hypothetical protein
MGFHRNKDAFLGFSYVWNEGKAARKKIVKAANESALPEDFTSEPRVTFTDLKGKRPDRHQGTSSAFRPEVTLQNASHLTSAAGREPSGGTMSSFTDYGTILSRNFMDRLANVEEFREKFRVGLRDLDRRGLAAKYQGGSPTSSFGRSDGEERDMDPADEKVVAKLFREYPELPVAVEKIPGRKQTVLDSQADRALSLGDGNVEGFTKIIINPQLVPAWAQEIRLSALVNDMDGESSSVDISGGASPQAENSTVKNVSENFAYAAELHTFFQGKIDDAGDRTTHWILARLTEGPGRRIFLTDPIKDTTRAVVDRSNSNALIVVGTKGNVVAGDFEQRLDRLHEALDNIAADRGMEALKSAGFQMGAPSHPSQHRRELTGIALSTGLLEGALLDNPSTGALLDEHAAASLRSGVGVPAAPERLMALFRAPSPRPDALPGDEQESSIRGGEAAPLERTDVLEGYGSSDGSWRGRVAEQLEDQADRAKGKRERPDMRNIFASPDSSRNGEPPMEPVPKEGGRSVTPPNNSSRD